MQSIIRSVFHFIIICASFYLAYLTRSYTDLIPFTQLHIPVLNLDETMLYGVLSAGMFVSIGILRNLYPIKQPNTNYVRSFFDSIVIRLITITFLAYFGSGVVFLYGISRLVIVFGVLISSVLMFIIDIFIDAIVPPFHQIILIINNSHSTDISKDLNHFEQYHIHQVPYQENLDIKQQIQQHKPHYVILVGDIPRDHLQYIADKTNIAGSAFLHLAEGMLLDDLNYQITRLGPILGLQYRTNTITERDGVIKRICDIIGSSLGLIILSPIMLMTVIIIWLFDKGPIFYRHKRIGRNGVSFDYIKFRSMRLEYCTGEYFGTTQSEEYWKKLQDSELNVRKGELQKIANDPRITPIGRFIRKYSIDELPSLRCILKGDMSIVGPRPHLDFEVARYASRMKRLLVVKPGMTCYSQIYGRDKLPFSDEAKFDLYYIQNWTLAFDFYIIIATVKVLFKGR
ncbi:MAG: sugar transferase [Candidatus Absconditabacterales bacterium]